MARYIDADKIPYVQSEDGVLDDYAFRYDINEIPTANVMEVDGDINLLKEKKPKEIWVGTDDLPIVYVPVVRCKDCESYMPATPTCGNCYRTTGIQHPDDFCSHGKRRDQK